MATAFTTAKAAFDSGPGLAAVLPATLVPVHGNPKTNVPIRGTAGQPLEEYYRWQFIYALIYGGLFPKDYIGAEVWFPKGNQSSQALKLDAAIFDDPKWIDHYTEFWKKKKSAELEWLNEHLLAIVEFKKSDKELEKIFTGQIKPAMREKDPPSSYVLGVYYDAERLYLFHRRDGLYLRYDEAKNQKGDDSKVGDLSLHLPNPYLYLPSFVELHGRVHKPTAVNRSARTIADLDVITSIATVQI